MEDGEAADTPQYENRSRRVVDLLRFDLEDKYDEAWYSLSRLHELEPYRTPNSGPELELAAYKLGVARFNALAALEDDGLSDALQRYLDILRSELGQPDFPPLPKDISLLLAKKGIGSELTEATFDLLMIGAALDAVYSAPSRAARLLAHVGRRSISNRALLYLRRAIRLYLFGFDAEAIVMSAAAIESAYEERFPDEIMIKHTSSRSGGFSLYEYERVAVKEGVYTRELCEKARRLRYQRNDVMHSVPEPAMSGLDAIEICAELLDRIFPSAEA